MRKEIGLKIDLHYCTFVKIVQFLFARSNPRFAMSLLSPLLCPLLRPLCSPALTCLEFRLEFRRPRSFWRWSDQSHAGVWPNSKKHTRHHKHWFPHVTWGAHKQMQLRCVDNSKIGREAMAEGKPPYVIHIYSKKHLTVSSNPSSFLLRKY